MPSSSEGDATELSRNSGDIEARADWTAEPQVGADILVGNLTTATALHQSLFRLGADESLAVHIADSLAEQAARLESPEDIGLHLSLDAWNCYYPFAVGLALHHPRWQKSCGRAVDIDRFWNTLAITIDFGTGEDTAGLATDIEDVCKGPLQVLQDIDYCPEIGIHIDTEFLQQPPVTRTRTLQYIRALSRGTDVTLSSDPEVLRKLTEKHPDLMPAVSEESIALTNRGPHVEQNAVEVLKEHGQASLHRKLLLYLHDKTDGGTLYTDLYDRFDVSQSRVRQVVMGLCERGAVYTTHVRGDETIVGLLEVGEIVADQIKQHREAQSRLTEFDGETR